MPGLNLTLWLDASDSATLYQNTACTARVSASGQSVACWKDKSGSGNHVVKTTGLGNAPTFNASLQLNGLPGLDFTQLASLRSAPCQKSLDLTVFIVASVVNPQSLGVLWGHFMEGVTSPLGHDRDIAWRKATTSDGTPQFHSWHTNSDDACMWVPVHVWFDNQIVWT